MLNVSMLCNPSLGRLILKYSEHMRDFIYVAYAKYIVIQQHFSKKKIKPYQVGKKSKVGDN